TIGDLADAVGFGCKNHSGGQTLCEDHLHTMADKCLCDTIGNAVCNCGMFHGWSSRTGFCARKSSKSAAMRSISFSPIGVDRLAAAPKGNRTPFRAKYRVSSRMRKF